MEPERQWLVTAPHPLSPATGYDAGRRGWKLHAVPARDNETFSAIRKRRAACGLLARHGWDLDMYIESRCERCEAALGRVQREARP